MTLQEQFGQIDIYVFDQILRGNFVSGMRLLDAGCGYGRNLVYLLREGCEVFALDSDAEAVSHVRALAAQLRPDLSAANVAQGTIEALSFPLTPSTLFSATPFFTLRAMRRIFWRCLRSYGVSCVRAACCFAGSAPASVWTSSL